MDKPLDLSSLGLAEKQLISQAFETFNKAIEKLRGHQAKLQHQVEELNHQITLKNQELTNVLLSMKSGLIVTDLLGKVKTFNRAASAITGIARDQALDQEINQLLGLDLLPSPLDPAKLEGLNQGGARLFSFLGEGDEILLEVTTTLIESEEKELQGIILNLEDVTLLKRLQQEAERKNRLAAMGQIAMQVAHEVRNPLGSIELFVSMMKKDFAPDSTEMELMQHITSARHSINHIISNLLEYSRPKPVPRDRLDLGPVLLEFVEFVKHTAEQQSVEIHLAEPSLGLWVTGNEQLIKQTLLNLFMNACQAMEEGGDLYLEAASEEVTDSVVLERFQKQTSRARDQLEVIRLTIKDTGRGMDEETQKRLFDPFFTTREQGTGLGMSIVHKTMASHGGAILVQSKQDQGTQIDLLFPAINLP